MTTEKMNPAGAQPFSLADIFGATSDDFWYWSQTAGYRTEAWLRACLPALPSEAIQRKYTGRAGDMTLEQAFGFYQICKQELAARGKSVLPECRILDFGCGWGRITRFWLKDVHPWNVLGVDVSEAAIALCREANFSCRFERIPFLPPLPLPDASLDYVFAYSVFSHLSEAAARAWMEEFSRVLKPGGAVLATTRPREAVLEFQKLRTAGEVPDFAVTSAAAFADVEAALNAYDAGKFYFDPAGGAPELPADYGEAMIPLPYARMEYGRYFYDVQLLDFKQHYRFDQNLLLLQKSEAKPASGPAAGKEKEAERPLYTRVIEALQRFLDRSRMQSEALERQLQAGREQAAQAGEDTARAREEAACAREEAARAREETARACEETARAREEAARVREQAVMLGEQLAESRRTAMQLRQQQDETLRREHELRMHLAALKDQRARSQQRIHELMEESRLRLRNLEAAHQQQLQELTARQDEQKLAWEARQAEAGARQQTQQQALEQQQRRLAWLRRLLAQAHAEIQEAHFQASRLQQAWPACRQTLARKLQQVQTGLEGFVRQNKHYVLQLPAAAAHRALRFFLGRRQSRPDLVRMVQDSGWFDTAYYLRTYPEVRARGLEPVAHYLRYGAAELKNPNPYFHTAYYLEKYPEVEMSGQNPLVHFMTVGVAEYRDPSPLFDSIYYLENNPDVAQAGIQPFRHFWFYGQQEGRLPRALSASSGPAAEPGDPGSGPAVSEAAQEEARPESVQARRQRVLPPAFRPVPGRPRIIAFYLPQYHPIPENDEWWGKGFTEWENVAQAKPLFAGHYQPHLPADLGFYDLRVSDIREQQAALARAYGIHGFCYYYYWFNGRKLLERPLADMLASGKPDFPFCICWANENWTRQWDGEDQDILLAQEHSLESDVAFIHDVIPILKDPRYIRYQGNPVLLVYRVDRMQDPKATAAAWRRICAQHGLPGVHLCAVENLHFGDPRLRGFDALVEFPPNHFSTADIAAAFPGLHPRFSGHIADYCEIRDHSLGLADPDFIYHRGLMGMWDNTPRRGPRSVIFHRATPEHYEVWLRSLLAKTEAKPEKDALVFINAWNEWGEGAHLEPDLKYGHAFLEATARALRGEGAVAVRPPAAAGRDSNRRQESPGVPGLALFVHDALRHGAQYIALAIARTLAESGLRRVSVVLKNGGELTSEFAKYGRVIKLDEEVRRLGSEQAALESIRCRLEADNIRQCLCNTVVTGDLADYFKRHGFRIVALVHELPTLINTYGYQGLAEQMAGAADTVIFPSRYVQAAFQQWCKIKPRQCLIRPQGVLHPNPYLGRRVEVKRKVAKRHGLGPDAKIVLNCAYGDLRKAPDIFMAVAKIVLEKLPGENIHFLWAGGLQSEWSAWIRHDLEKTGLGGRVHMLGFQHDDALYMAAADVFALTSREDPFPNVNLSAMESGVPVVAFAESGGAPEVLADGSGVVVPYLDIQGMAKAICDLLQDAARREHIGRRAAEKAGRLFGFREYVECLLEQFAPADPALGQ